MKKVIVTQRVDVIKSYNERRDALDQKWFELLNLAGILPTVVPNNTQMLSAYLKSASWDGILLTGGNSLQTYGGNAPERDALETKLVSHAIRNNIPLLGVCRGMQVLLDYFGTKLHPISGHVSSKQQIAINGKSCTVNSFHDWGCKDAPEEMDVWAKASDDVIKAVRHRETPLYGIMWHPERISPFRQADIGLLQQIYY